MKIRFSISLVAVTLVLLSFDFPKNQQPQQLGSPYYAELINKHKVSADARIAFMKTRYVSFDAEFNQSNSNLNKLSSKVDSFLASKGLKEISFANNYKSIDLPEVYFGTIADVIDVPMYVNRMNLEGQSKTMSVLAFNKGKKKFLEELKVKMQSENIDYLVVPILRESFIYPSAPLKEYGIFKSTTASAKNYYIDLGTNHVIKGERLQSLDDPIGIFIVGMGLMNKEGKMVAMVAEGIDAAPQSKFVEQMLNIRTMFGPQDFNRLLSGRRTDLEGSPLNWEEACKNALLHLKQENKFVPEKKYQFVN